MNTQQIQNMQEETLKALDEEIANRSDQTPYRDSDNGRILALANAASAYTFALKERYAR